MSVTVLSLAYGDYWDKWGVRWIENLEEHGSAAGHVILVSDRPLPVPEWVQNVVLGPQHMSVYANVGTLLARTDWVCWHGLDDLFLPGAFNKFDDSGAFFSYPHVQMGIRDGQAKYIGGYETMYTLEHNPMLGGFFHRREALLEIPYRRYGYMDEVQFCEMAYFGYEGRFSDVPRSIWWRHDEAHAMHHHPVFRDSANEFKQRLINGLIQKGVPERDRMSASP